MLSQQEHLREPLRMSMSYLEGIEKHYSMAVDLQSLLTRRVQSKNMPDISNEEQSLTLAWRLLALLTMRMQNKIVREANKLSPGAGPGTGPFVPALNRVTAPPM